MPRKKLSPKAVGPDWFLSDWMRTLQVRPVDLVHETGMGKATISDIVNGRTDYYRALVNEMARALKIEPFELLMPPDEAYALRRLRATALTIAAEPLVPWREMPEDLPEWPARAG